MPPEDNPADDVPADKDAYDEWVKQHAQPRIATYDAMKRELHGLLDALAVLTGDVMPSSRATMKEHIQTAGFHALRLHQQLELAGLGRHEPMIVFPSPNDWEAES